MKGIFFLFLFGTLISQAQSKNELFYGFDKGWKPVDNLEGAAYFMHMVKENNAVKIYE